MVATEEVFFASKVEPTATGQPSSIRWDRVWQGSKRSAHACQQPQRHDHDQAVFVGVHLSGRRPLNAPALSSREAGGNRKATRRVGGLLQANDVRLPCYRL